MGLYSKIELFGFADFYHRFSMTGLTIDEMFLNWVKYTESPRDINDPITIPRKMKKVISKITPAAVILWRVLNKACEIGGVTKIQVNSKFRNREYVNVRQHVCYVGFELGFKPVDFERILKWDRTSVYSRGRVCITIAEGNKNYRLQLNKLISITGLEQII